MTKTPLSNDNRALTITEEYQKLSKAFQKLAKTIDEVPLIQAINQFVHQANHWLESKPSIVKLINNLDWLLIRMVVASSVLYWLFLVVIVLLGE